MKKEHHFYTKSGKQLKSLRELAVHLEQLPASDHDHHISTTNNDFANWIRHVFGHHDLADKVEKTNNPQRMSRLIQSHYAPRSEIKIREAKPMARKEIKQRLSKIRDMDFIVPSVKVPAPLKLKDAKVAKKAIKKTTLKKAVKNAAPIKAAKKSVKKAILKAIPKPKKSAPKFTAKKQVSKLKIPKPAKSKVLMKAPCKPYSVFCGHSAHMNCIRCGAMEFTVGLIIGLTLALMYTRVF